MFVIQCLTYARDTIISQHISIATNANNFLSLQISMAHIMITMTAVQIQLNADFTMPLCHQRVDERIIDLYNTCRSKIHNTLNKKPVSRIIVKLPAKLIGSNSFSYWKWQGGSGKQEQLPCIFSSIILLLAHMIYAQIILACDSFCLWILLQMHICRRGDAKLLPLPFPPLLEDTWFELLQILPISVGDHSPNMVLPKSSYNYRS